MSRRRKQLFIVFGIMLWGIGIMALIRMWTNNEFHLNGSVEEYWITKTKGLDLNTHYGRREGAIALVEILGRLPPEEFEEEYERAVRSARWEEKNTAYTNILPEVILTSLVYEKDMDRAVDFLARTGMADAGPDLPVELYLAYVPKSDPPMKVLETAYKNAYDKKAKAGILLCFERAFPSLRKTISNDDEFVEMCVRIESQGRAKLYVNPNYPTGDLYLIKP